MKYIKMQIITAIFALYCVAAQSSPITIQTAKGWHESCYAEFSKGDYNMFHAYVKGADGNYVKLDKELVRNYGSYGRADALGLKAGDYTLRIVPVDSLGVEMEADAIESGILAVDNYDRSGFAHFGRTEGVGAYNNDGTLKSNAELLYITAQTASKVQMDVVTSSKGAKTTATGIQSILDLYLKGYETRPLCIRMIGKITKGDLDHISSSAEGLQIKNNKSGELNITIEGVGNDATTSGFGFLLHGARSVELRNFANMLCMDDAISIDTDNKNVWVHHLDLFYGNTGSDSDQAKGDGTIDIKGGSSMVTVSYNHLYDCGKASLCGMSSESTTSYISYHHNWFDHCDSRMPRVRTMSVHVYNNYFDGVSKYGAGATMGSSVFVENNYFRNTKCPMLISKQGSDIAYDPDGKGTFSGEDGGIIKSYGNVMVNPTHYTTYQQDPIEFDAYEATTRSEAVPATVTAKQGGSTYNNFDTNPQLIYSVTPDIADSVPSILKGETNGAGRINHGDFSWGFSNQWDTDYDVDMNLKKALQDYKPTLISIFGGDSFDHSDHPIDGGDGDDTPDNPTQITCDTIVSGTIIYPMVSDNTVDMQAEISEGLLSYLAADAWTFGTKLKIDSVKPVNDIYEIAFGTSSSTKSAESGNAVSFPLSITNLSDTFYLCITNIAFYASHIGTDKGKVDITLCTDSTEEFVYSGLTPKRNKEEYGWYSNVSQEIRSKAYTQVTPTLHLYGYDKGKELGIGQVVISCCILTPHRQSTAIVNPIYTDEVRYYDLMGRILETEPLHGLYIRVSRDGIVKILK